MVLMLPLVNLFFRLVYIKSKFKQKNERVSRLSSFIVELPILSVFHPCLVPVPSLSHSCSILVPHRPILGCARKALFSKSKMNTPESCSFWVTDTGNISFSTQIHCFHQVLASWLSSISLLEMKIFLLTTPLCMGDNFFKKSLSFH